MTEANSELQYFHYNFGKFVESKKPWPVVPLRDHQCTSRSAFASELKEACDVAEGWEAGLGRLCEPHALFPGQMVEAVASPYVLSTTGALVGRLCENDSQRFYVISRVRLRPEQGEHQPGRMYTQVRSVAVRESDFNKFGPAWLMDGGSTPFNVLAAVPDEFPDSEPGRDPTDIRTVQHTYNVAAGQKFLNSCSKTDLKAWGQPLGLKLRDHLPLLFGVDHTSTDIPDRSKMS